MAEELTIDGIDELIKKLDGSDILDILYEPMARAVLRIQARMAQYPPQRPGSKYRRTGSYGRKWTHRISRTNELLSGFAGNNIIYGPFVGSAQFQAHWMTHWPTDQRVLNEEKPHIISDFQAAINDALKD